MIILKEIKKINNKVSSLVFENKNGKKIDIIIPIELANVIDANLKLISINEPKVDEISE